ncbi:small ribosomal subunit protein mS27 [Sinocyclocheilus rhinocerous]|uniref:small ribosomal subunit protein mS27 n=1 Tax=Sinocyclocheilus rhinocerous TaxID=307959 RepID=UPI0007B8E975|nr:PREDICTED: 28S ribosomal protein S27, mitochondrial [Sinocyclocheilus rhinocerous]
MAASILQRGLSPLQTFTKCVSYRSIARRCLLSSAYTDPAVWEQRPRDAQDLGQLASLMDRTYARKFPVSSLVIARFVDNLSSKEEVDQAQYYLYKFRHSPNCWYLRDWTIHSWIRHCLKYGARDKALYTLKNKWQEERNVGASLMLAGLKQENSVGFSARLLGLALIGKVELSRGIHAVFHEMPLIWTSGYLGRALAVMDAVCDFRDIKLSEEVLDHVEKILQDLSVNADGQNVTDTPLEEEDELETQKLPEYINRFKELKERLVSQDRIDSRSLESLVSALTQQTLAACENADIAEYQQTVSVWEAELQQLIQRERETKEKNQKSV